MTDKQLSRKRLSIKNIKALPKTPGVYIYKNAQDTVIYVGKAKSLRNRVGSYFVNNLDKHSKTYFLVQEIRVLEYIEVLSEFEALILEATLIKKYKPKYNIALKDDKSYLYIVLRKDIIDFGNGKCSSTRVFTARRTDLLKGDITFGPYTNSDTTRYISRILRKLLPFRDCTLPKLLRYHKLAKPCLYGYLNLCPGCCIHDSATDLSQYAKNLSKLKHILAGRSKFLFNKIQRDMLIASKGFEYEKAASYRDLLSKFSSITQSFRSPESYIDNPYLVDDLAMQALTELQSVIPVLTKLPKRIECYDISNISGKEATGSMVVAIDGKLAKSEYKRFKVKLLEDPNDVGMMQEVIHRRVLRELDPSKKRSWSIPELIVLDGGKPQVSAIYDLLDKLQADTTGRFSDKRIFSTPIIGLAKKFETIVYRDRKSGSLFEINLSQRSEGLKLLQKLRDEAHRFAQKYHHLLRIKKLIV